MTMTLPKVVINKIIARCSLYNGSPVLYDSLWSFRYGVRRLTSFRVPIGNVVKHHQVIASRYAGLKKSTTLWCQHSPLLYTNGNQFVTTVRLNHTGKENELQGQEILLPSLMQFPPIVWPRFINAVRNWFFITFIIKPYFDKEFSMQDFITGAKEAVSVVAQNLSEGKLEDLEGLVEPMALAQIKESISKFTVFQQQLLRVTVEDVFFAFPYQIGIIIPDEVPRDQYPEGVKPPPQTRHVEITVCLHVLRGLAERQKSGEVGAAFNFQEFTQDERNKQNVMICNYRFFKDFTEGSPDPSWIINMVNHFLPMELNANKK